VGARAVQRVAQDGVADEVKHAVDAAVQPPGERAVVEQHLVRSQPAQQRHAVGRAGGGDDRRAMVDREVHRRLADRRRRAAHQHPVARREGEVAVERDPGGGVAAHERDHGRSRRERSGRVAERDAGALDAQDVDAERPHAAAHVGVGVVEAEGPDGDQHLPAGRAPNFLQDDVVEGTFKNGS
jgi:hypothetical protein